MNESHRNRNNEPTQNGNEKIMPKFVYLFLAHLLFWPPIHTLTCDSLSPISRGFLANAHSHTLVATNSHKCSSFFSLSHRCFFIVVVVVARADYVLRHVCRMCFMDGFGSFFFFSLDCHLPRWIVMVCAWHVV